MEKTLIELLAIKLYEHDFHKWPVAPDSQPSWSRLSQEDREAYRQHARDPSR